MDLLILANNLGLVQDMTVSYADIKQCPCIKCNKMTDDKAQLPTLRVCKEAPGSQTKTWEAFHAGCFPTGR